MEFWEASRLVVETHSGLDVSNSCARQTSAPLCVYLQCVAALGEPAANRAVAPFVGKNRRVIVQRGVLLCGVGHQRKNALEKPVIRVVPFPGADRCRLMVKHSCCAQWIARMADFLGIHARTSAAD
jgi:hypothetical protein